MPPPAVITPISRPGSWRWKTVAAPSRASSMISMATQNLINMVTVSAVSGTVLLGLLAAKHF